MFDLNSPSLPHYLFLILVTNFDFIFHLGYFKKKQPVQKSIIRKEIILRQWREIQDLPFGEIDSSYP